MKANSLIKMISFSATGMIAAAGCSGNGQISGTFEDYGNGKVIVSVFNPGEEDPVVRDTILLDNGKFAYEFNDTSAAIVHISVVGEQENSPATMLNPLVFLPGDKLRISGPADSPEISGSDIYDGLAELEEFKSVKKRLEEMYRKANEIDTDDAEAVEAVNNEYDSIMAYKDSISMEYIKNNPSEVLSAYLTLYLTAQQGLDAYELLDEKVRTGAMGGILSDQVKKFRVAAERERNKENIQSGKPAPEFILKDIDGNVRTLSSFKGKYVLLDFWGKWCYWCMKGMPEMKKYYEKYNSKIEFVGINHGDSEEVWKKTVAEEGLNWTNLYNGTDNGIITRYAVEGFPTKILIDKDGKIVDVFVGESEELYDKLDELF